MAMCAMAEPAGAGRAGTSPIKRVSGVFKRGFGLAGVLGAEAGKGRSCGKFSGGRV